MPRPRSPEFDGRALRQWRDRNGYTQEALSEAIEVWLRDEARNPLTGEMAPRWRAYGLQERPAGTVFSPSTIRRIETEDRASATYAKVLRDFQAYHIERRSLPHQVPSPPADFSGRVNELQTLLAAVEEGASIVCIRGMGGVGKTALALKLAERLESQYPDAQIFLDLKGAHEHRPLEVAKAMALVIRAFNPAAELPDDATALSNSYRSVLHGKRVLLLLDNARDADQVAPLAPRSNCLVLTTSRWHFQLPGACSINLEVLPEPDAVELASGIAPRLASHASQLVAMCHCLPLALRVSASAVAVHSNIAVEEYLEQLRRTKEYLDLADTSKPDGGRSVTACVRLSYELLPSDEHRDRWRRLAAIAGTFEEGAAAAAWAAGVDEVRDTLSMLFACSLVQFNEENRRYYLHDLVWEVANERLGP